MVDGVAIQFHQKVCKINNMKLDHPKSLHRYPKRGSNQADVGNYNEKLVLQLVREHGSLTKAEATRETGLSANATSVIFRSLEEQGLLSRGEPIRGRIGQPSTPLRINPAACHYVALKIGRRSIELAVVNFVGDIISIQKKSVPFPTPKMTLEFVKTKLNAVLRSAKQSRKTILGMGVAMPFELWSWTAEFGAPKDEMETWRDFDAVNALGAIVPWEIIIENDATSACRAELVFGSHADKQDWIYFFIGTFIGGGVVLNGSVFPGRRGNAGGFGPMRVPVQEGGNRLVDHASLVSLEHSLAKAGESPFLLYEQQDDWNQFEPFVGHWISHAGRNLAHAIVSSLAVIDFEAVVIDGAMPTSVRSRLVDEVFDQLERTDLQGVVMPKIETGQVGLQARTKGAAATFICRDFLIG